MTSVFDITDQPLDGDALHRRLSGAATGGVVIFEGRVRDHNAGRAVASLEYEIYESMARAEAARICAEAREKFAVVSLAGAHRRGHLEVGELAVWLGVGARHRAEAFAACRYLIDEIKARLPVWKKEYYRDGTTEWVACHRCAEPERVTAASYYSRQLALSDFGAAGQQALARGRVLVVGAGGLGCPALSALAGAGVGRITICDGDRLDVTNLHRQTLYTVAEVGQPKAELAAARLRALNPLPTIAARTERVTGGNVRQIVADHDVILDCSDNFATRFLVHDTCFRERKVLVQAGIYQYEGQLQVFDFRRETAAGCLRCLWPTEPAPDCVGGCTTVGVLGAVPAVLGGMQALEAIKVLVGRESPAAGATILVDLLTLETRRVARPRRPGCPLCGAGPAPRSEPAPDREPWEIGLGEYRARFPGGRIIDIREAWERASVGGQDPAWEHMPLSDPAPLLALDPDRDTLLVCQHGIRTYRVVAELRDQGQERVWSLPGGVSSLPDGR